MIQMSISYAQHTLTTIMHEIYGMCFDILIYYKRINKSFNLEYVVLQAYSFFFLGIDKLTI